MKNIEFENFNNLVLQRQACRKFQTKPVENEKLDAIMELALLAPSACNSQPWKLVCITSKSKVDLVRDCLQTGDHNKFLDNVTSFIAVVDQDATLRADVDSAFSKKRFVQYDVGELIAYLTLAAKSLGLDTCIIGWMNEQEMPSILGLDQNEVCKIVIAVGYSDDKLRTKIRKPKEQKIVKI